MVRKSIFAGILTIMLMFVVACADDQSDDMDDATTDTATEDVADTDDEATDDGELEPTPVIDDTATDDEAEAEPTPVEEATDEVSDDSEAEAAQPDDGDAEIILTDYTGEEIVLDEHPERIACLNKMCFDILYELGLEPVAHNDPLAFYDEYYGEDADAFIYVGGAFAEPNLEDIAESEPDLVVGLGGVHDTARDGIESIAPLLLTQARTYEDSIDYLLQIGVAVGEPERAEEQAQTFRDRLDYYSENAPMDRTALIMLGADPTLFQIDTLESIYGHMFNYVVDYPWGNEEGTSDGRPQYSVEEILDVDPEVIFVQTISFGPEEATPLSEEIAELSPVWGELSAVQDGEVHEVSFNLWSGGGSRALGLMLDEAMPLIYPDEFPEPLERDE